MPDHPRIVAPPGFIRFNMRKWRKAKLSTRQHLDVDRRAEARAAVDQIPVFDHAAGMAELDGYHERR